MKKILILLFTTVITTGTFAQGYEIYVKINNLRDSLIYMGHHYGNGFFINDSIKLDKNGQALFKGDKPLPGGIYFLFLPGNKYFDFFLDKHQRFSIMSDTTDFLNTVKFGNSYQNLLFFNYQKYLNQQYKEINQLKQVQKKYITNLDSLMLIEDDIQLIYNKIYLTKEEIIAKHPDSLISVILKAGMPIVAPQSPLDNDGNPIDSLYEFKYIKHHFFGNINFADTRLLRTSIIQNKILEYLTQVVTPQYDSVISAVDKVIAKASVNEEVYKFVLNSLFQFYNRSQIISDENVFVHIAENYYLAGKTPWVLPELHQKLSDDLKKRKPNLVGAIAPDFNMKDEKGKPVNLRKTQNKYTILYFYDTDCEICHEVSPELRNLYRIIRDRGVNVFGIYVGKDKTKWANYITEKNLNWINVWDPDNKSGFRENYNIAGTPVIYILDEDQKILAKRINVDQLMNYFNSLE
jgi:peroxiredoxin